MGSMCKKKSTVLIVLISAVSLLIVVTGCTSKKQTNADVISVLNERSIELILDNYEDGPVDIADIVPDQIYYGSFSEEGANEIFVLCRILNTPHAMGLDKRVGVVLNAETLEKVAYREFRGDGTVVSCMKTSKGLSRILFLETAVSQGMRRQAVMLYAVSDGQWVELPIDLRQNITMERREELELECFCYLSEERMVVVYEQNQWQDEPTDPVEIIGIYNWDPDKEQFVLEQ